MLNIFNFNKQEQKTNLFNLYQIWCVMYLIKRIIDIFLGMNKKDNSGSKEKY